MTVTVTADPATDDPPVSSRDPGSASGPSTPPWPTDAAREKEAFAEGFAQVQQRLSGPAGVALMPVGGGRALTTGEKTSGYAWSTIKVPIALAALREHNTASVREDVRTSLRDSDNDSAARLWRVAGGSGSSGRAVEKVLREAGDENTDARAGSRDGFGHIRWTLPDSAQFTAMLPCLDGAEPILDEMAQVNAGQHWGFANVPGAQVKGGWGPVDPDGGEDSEYLVRQIAVIPAAEGYAAASVLVYSAGFEQGKADLDLLADWAAGFAEGMGGSCTADR